MFKPISLSIFLSLAAILSADQVVLKNGDTLSGAIVKKDGAKLTIKSEFLGEVSMPWTAVKSIKSDESLTVVLPGGESVSGKIATSGDNLEVATASGNKSAPLAAVDTLRNPAEQRSWERLQRPRLCARLWNRSHRSSYRLPRKVQALRPEFTWPGDYKRRDPSGPRRIYGCTCENVVL